MSDLIIRDPNYAKFTSFIEELAENVSNLDFRAKVIAILEKTKQELKKIDLINERDIKNLMLLCGKILDQITILESNKSLASKLEKLIKYLKEILAEFEHGYIKPYYERYGYLPSYPYEYYDYQQRMYNYWMYGKGPSYYYFENKYKPKNKVNIEDKEQLSKSLFNDIIAQNDGKRPIFDHPNLEFEELMRYTYDKLEQKTNELKQKRIELEKIAEKETELNQEDPLRARINLIANLLIQSQKRKLEGQ